MSSASSGRKLVPTLALVLASLLAAGSAAWASAPQKGKHYSGAATTDKYWTVSFSVSADGKKVVNLKLVPPSKCETGAFKPAPPQSAKITSKGTFKTTFSLMPGGPSGGKAGTETVTGAFQSGGKEKGRMTTHATGTLAGCSDSASYTTKAS